MAENTTAKKRTYTKRKTTNTAAEKPVEAKEKVEQVVEGEMEAYEKPVAKKPVAVPDANEEMDALRKKNEEMEAMMKAMQEQMAQMQRQASAPQIIQVSQDTERVVMAWMAPVSDDNTVTFGENGLFGRITGKTGTVSVPKSEWSRFYDDEVRSHINRRWLIPVSGLTEEEMAAYGMVYGEGELLEVKVFRNPAALGDKIKEIYPKLCKEHKAMVASAWRDAYASGDPNADNRNLVMWLNEHSTDRDFDPVIAEMNRKDMGK